MFQYRVADAVRQDFVRGQITRAGQYRTEDLDRQSPLFDFFRGKDEIPRCFPSPTRA